MHNLGGEKRERRDEAAVPDLIPITTRPSAVTGATIILMSSTAQPGRAWLVVSLCVRLVRLYVPRLTAGTAVVAYPLAP